MGNLRLWKPKVALARSPFFISHWSSLIQKLGEACMVNSNRRLTECNNQLMLIKQRWTLELLSLGPLNLFLVMVNSPMEISQNTHLILSPLWSPKSPSPHKVNLIRRKWKRVACQIGHNVDESLASRERIVEALRLVSPQNLPKKNQHLTKVSDEPISLSSSELVVVALQPLREL